MNIVVERLHKGSDLKLEITRIAQEQKITAGCIINAVGSLSHMNVRTDVQNGKLILKNYGKVEIVSLIGTIGEFGAHTHIHIAGGQIDGVVVGGHLVEGCIVHTTVELMILSINNLKFLTEKDIETGFQELIIKKINN